ncbi:MAG: B12-binding domain-containing radical SAM protein [Spirochaetes bacterium]|nr:B12-binding domain-containing radical SAM protein [Spirochaetota bacterium]
MKEFNLLIINLPIPEYYKKIQKGNTQLFKDYVSSIIVKNKIKGINILKIERTVLEAYNNRALTEEIIKLKADIVCFSCYLWNIERNISIASALRGRGIITVAGGPEILSDNRYLFEKKYFDYYIQGEGEYELLSLINRLSMNENITSNHIISSRNVDFNDFLKIYSKLTDDYKYDKLFYLEIERGCPYNCIYCAYSKFRKSISSIDFDIYRKIINDLYDKQINEIYLLAPTLNRDKAVFNDYLKVITEVKKNNNKEIKLFAEVRPETLTDNDIKLMSEAGFKEIEFGIQTLDADKYDDLKRGKLKFDFIGLTEKLIENNINPIIDFIIGLPGETYDDIISSIDFLDKNKLIGYLQFYQLHVLGGTELRKIFDDKKYNYEKYSPYLINSNDVLDLADIKKIYYYLETSKNFSYEDNFYDFDPDNFYLVKNESDLNIIAVSPFYHSAALIFIDNMDCLKIIKFYEKYLSENPEIFHCCFLFSNNDYNLKFIDDLNNIFLKHKNYYDHFKDNINFNHALSLSKKLILLVEPEINQNKLDILLDNYPVDYIIFPDLINQNKLKIDYLKDNYEKNGIITHVFKNNSLKNEFINQFPVYFK